MQILQHGFPLLAELICGEGVNNALYKREILLYNEYRHTKHGTVGGNEWQEDAESLIQ